MKKSITEHCMEKEESYGDIDEEQEANVRRKKQIKKKKKRKELRVCGGRENGHGAQLCSS